MHVCPFLHIGDLSGKGTCRLAMATLRSRKTVQQHVVEFNSGTDSVEELQDDNEQALTESQWLFLDGLEHIGKQLPSRGSDGSLPAWGGMDFKEMTPEQQTVYLVGSMTKVAAEGAVILDSEGSDYEETLIFYSKLLHDLDNGVHVPVDMKDLREQEFMDKCHHLSEQANGTRLEIMTAAENNISALAVELQTAR